jgi:hypothetical protein
MTIHGTVPATNVSDGVRGSVRWSAVRTDPERAPAGGALVLPPDKDLAGDDNVLRGRDPVAVASGTPMHISLGQHGPAQPGRDRLNQQLSAVRARVSPGIARSPILQRDGLPLGQRVSSW